MWILLIVSLIKPSTFGGYNDIALAAYTYKTGEECWEARYALSLKSPYAAQCIKVGGSK